LQQDECPEKEYRPKHQQPTPFMADALGHVQMKPVFAELRPSLGNPVDPGARQSAPVRVFLCAGLSGRQDEVGVLPVCAVQEWQSHLSSHAGAHYTLTLQIALRTRSAHFALSAAGRGFPSIRRLVNSYCARNCGDPGS
jgi:hypothetical protein